MKSESNTIHYLRFWYILACLLCCAHLHGQSLPNVNEIINSYESGKHQALRDVFLLFEQRSSIALEDKISRGYYFDLQDPSFKLRSSNDALKYYYEHQNQIQYYPLWGMFLRNDLPIPLLPYAITDIRSDPHELVAKSRNIIKLIGSKNYKAALDLTNSLSFSEIFNSQRILLDALDVTQKANFPCSRATQLYAAIISKLYIVGDQYTFQNIQNLFETQDCKTSHKLTMKYIDEHRNTILEDSSFVAVEKYSKTQYIHHKKLAKYSQILNISESHFSQEIDFLGKILTALPIGSTYDENEIINIMLESKDSKSLYYIAAKWFIYAKENHPRAIALMDIIAHFIDHHIQVNTQEGLSYRTSTSTNDLLTKKTILAFWINNYSHYEWNEDVRKFINKNIQKEDRQKLVHLYKNLNKDNTAFALKSYQRLIQSDPILLAEVDKIYSKKLLNYNSQLPTRKYKYLLQLSRLASYCKNNNLPYHIKDDLTPLVDDLLKANSIEDIISIENKIVAALTKENVTAFEIWSVIHSGTEHIKYSATRITNLFYNSHINDIIDSPRYLSLFLKKANLFKNFGDHGASKYLLKKIENLEILTEAKLQLLNSTILDEDILSSIKYITSSRQRKISETTKKSFEDFLKSPLDLTLAEVSELNTKGKKQVAKLINRFHSKYNQEERFVILEWMSIHLPTTAISFLVRNKDLDITLTNRQKENISSVEYIANILSIYATEKDITYASSRHDQLFIEFFQEDLRHLSLAPELAIEHINDITESRYYTNSHRKTILSALSKVRPSRNIISARLDPKLSLGELKELLPTINSKRALDYLLNIADVDQNDELIEYLIKHAQSLDAKKGGIFINDLFKKRWFNEYINDPNSNADLITQIQWVLSDYINNQDIKSAFEEETTYLNIIKIELANKSLRERIEKILNGFVDNEIKLKAIQNIIVEISYDEIPVILDYYTQIVQINGSSLFEFINNDFGIPMQGLADEHMISTLAADIRGISQREVYLKYLKKIGFQLLNSDTSLNISKIYEIITQDLVRPFVGTGGSVRDIYVFGSIKLLEAEYQTTLGFHQKLNESQSFYKYTSNKRTQAWQGFLERDHQDQL